MGNYLLSSPRSLRGLDLYVRGEYSERLKHSPLILKKDSAITGTTLMCHRLWFS